MSTYLLQWNRERADVVEHVRAQLLRRPGIRLRDLLVLDDALLAKVEADDAESFDRGVAGLDPVPIRHAEVQEEATGTSRKAGRRRRVRRADPLAFALLQWPAVIGLFELPAVWWGQGVRVLLGLWLLGTTSAAFADSVGRLKGYGVGVTLNALLFAVLWFVGPHWSRWPLIGLLALSMLALLSMVRDLPEQHA